jgi:predicted nucleotidyltransferase
MAARARRAADLSDPESVARVLLRLPVDLHRALAAQAAHEQTSVNDLCVQRLSGPDLPFLPRHDVAAVLARARAVVGPHLAGVLVHGSFARGEARAASDVDVLVVVNRALALTRTLYRQWDGETVTWAGRMVDAHFAHMPAVDTRPSSVWCEAATEGLVLFDARGDVSQALVTARAAIAQGHLVRKLVHGQPYWTVAA